MITRDRRWERFGRVTALAVFLTLLVSLVAASGRTVGAQADEVPSWTQLAADQAGPGPRWDHTLAADDEGQQLLVFGGRDGNGTPLGDTWLVDLRAETWTEIEGPAPEPRFGHAVAVDQEARRLYVFGGQAGETFFNDVWIFEFETGAWRMVDVADGPAPAVRYGTSAVLDGAGHLIVSHGFTFEGRFDDTWSLDLATGAWTEISPAAGAPRPLKRCLHEAVWDAEAGRMLLFGGCSSGFGPCPQGDLWSFDPSTRTWTEVIVHENPAPGSNPAFVADTPGGRALLLGGLTDAGYAADLWALTLGEYTLWQEITFEGDWPAARASHDTVYTDGRLYLFGGTSDAGTFNDLWALSFPSGES